MGLIFFFLGPFYFLALVWLIQGCKELFRIYRGKVKLTDTTSLKDYSKTLAVQYCIASLAVPLVVAILLSLRQTSVALFSDVFIVHPFWHLVSTGVMYSYVEAGNWKLQSELKAYLNKAFAKLFAGLFVPIMVTGLSWVTFEKIYRLLGIELMN